MSIRETRKKIQRTIVWLASEYPARIVAPELAKIQETLSAMIANTAEEPQAAAERRAAGNGSILEVPAGDTARILELAARFDGWRPDLAAWLRTQANGS